MDRAITLLLALLLTAGCNKSEAPEKAPETSPVFMISREGIIMDTWDHAWINFQTGELFSSSGTDKTPWATKPEPASIPLKG